MEIEQIKVGFDNFSYIIYEPKSRKAAVIDTSYDIRKTVKFLKSNNLVLEYIISTHYHSDHTFKNKKLKKLYPESKIVASRKDGDTLSVKVDIYVSDNDELSLGEIKLKFLLTPGHTPGGICIIANNKVLFTGDTLFIGDCGRADLSGGNIEDLFESLQRIKELSDNLIIYPGHDYGPKPYDTLECQKRTNKALLANSLDEFKKIN